MKKKAQNNSWTPVNIEGSVVSKNLEGLIGIEELCDYDENSLLLTEDKIRAEKRKLEQERRKTKKLKRNKDGTKSSKIKKFKNVKPPEPQKTNKKKKVEIGQIVHNENTDKKCSIEDLTAWNLVALPKEILQGLADLEFTTPTNIQQLTLPPAIFGQRDILGAAETGSGKTLAFGLPILAGILKFKQAQKTKLHSHEDAANGDENSENSEESDFEDENNEGTGCVKIINDIEIAGPKIKKAQKPLYALIVTPTRELAVQIKNHLVAAAKYTGINVAVILGGMAAVKQERILSKGPEIVVATPGRLWELIEQGNSHLSQIQDIKFFAIDETDRMLETHHFQELHQLLELLNRDESKRKQRQNFVFSATLTLVHELPNYLKRKKKLGKKKAEMTPAEKLQNIIEILGITNPKIVDVTKKEGTAELLTESRISCTFDEKDYYLYYFLLKHPGRTLVFCNSIGCVKRIATLLTLLQCKAFPLHASMQQRQRLKNLERFRDNHQCVLVATDVAARGLDIPKVDHVLHYQTPRTSESYVHRSGRTARASQEGLTVLLIEPSEVFNYVKLCRNLGRTEDLPFFPIQNDVLVKVKERVNLARILDKLELQKRKTNSESGWLQKAAKDMDIIIDDDDNFSTNSNKGEQGKLKRKINATRQELKSLIEKPIIPRGMSLKYPTGYGNLNIPLIQGPKPVEDALEVMKQHLEKNKKKKTRVSDHITRKLRKKNTSNNNDKNKTVNKSERNVHKIRSNNNKIRKSKMFKK